MYSIYNNFKDVPRDIGTIIVDSALAGTHDTSAEKASDAARRLQTQIPLQESRVRLAKSNITETVLPALTGLVDLVERLQPSTDLVVEVAEQMASDQTVAITAARQYAANLG